MERDESSFPFIFKSVQQLSSSVMLQRWGNSIEVGKKMLEIDVRQAASHYVSEERSTRDILDQRYHIGGRGIFFRRGRGCNPKYIASRGSSQNADQTSLTFPGKRNGSIFNQPGRSAGERITYITSSISNVILLSSFQATGYLSPAK